MKYNIFPAAVGCLLFFTQCNFQKIGRDTSKGISENSEAIARNLMSGVNKGLSDSAFRQNLNHLIDSFVSTAGGSANKSAKMLLDTLLSDKWINYTARLVEEATGKKLRSNVSAITGDLQLSVNNMLGTETRERVRMLVATAMSEVINDRLQLAVDRMRESLTGAELRNNLSQMGPALLNENTNAAIKAIVDTAMLTIAYRMKNDVNPSFKDNLSFIQRNATTLLIVLGMIALVIVVVIWRLKQKYAKMTTVLASQIHGIPDQQAYDDLTYRIKERATIAGIEPTLRKVLEENGLLGKESRDSWQAKKAALLQNKN